MLILKRMNVSASSKRFEFIDVSRAIAALAVFFQHSIESISAGFAGFSSRYFSLGVFGVVLFFLVSGFVIPPTLVKSGLKKFWIARFFRLYPLYWLVVVFAFLMGAHDPLITSGHSPLVLFLGNATMLQEFMGIPHMLGVFWTLSMELVIYIYCSLLFVFGFLKHPDRIMFYVGAGLLVTCLLFLFFLQRGFPAGRAFMIFSACVGMWVYQQPKILCKEFKMVAVTIGVVVAVAAYIRFGAFPVITASEGALSLFCVINSWLAAYVVFFVLKHYENVNFPGWLIAIGTWCYSIYLFHTFVLHYVPRFGSPVLWVVLCGCLVLGLSFLSWKFFEQPFINLGRMLNKKLSTDNTRPVLNG